MTLLLDTHAALWFLQGDQRLPDKTRQRIVSAGSGACVSVASLWEIAIKVSLGKMTLPYPFDDLFPDTISQSGLTLLEITVDHLSGVLRLDHLHRDPFDRLLIAQAFSENVAIVTCDSKLRLYGARTLWD